MLLYLDASCLVKFYVTEDHSDLARSWVDRASALITSELSFVEVGAAFARRRREGTYDQTALDLATARFQADWPHFHRMNLNPTGSVDLAQRHELRALDAIHLAAALDLRQAAARLPVAFASFDRRQSAAARLEGLLLASEIP